MGPACCCIGIDGAPRVAVLYAALPGHGCSAHESLAGGGRQHVLAAAACNPPRPIAPALASIAISSHSPIVTAGGASSAATGQAGGSQGSLLPAGYVRF